jgi:hypothetical protein
MSKHICILSSLLRSGNIYVQSTNAHPYFDKNGKGRWRFIKTFEFHIHRIAYPCIFLLLSVVNGYSIYIHKCTYVGNEDGN